MMALVGSALGFQPDIVPSSVAKMKRLGPDPFGPVTTKSLVPLKILPVGAEVVPAGLPPGGGMVTTSCIGGEPTWSAVPSPLYTVATPVPLSETHQGLVGLCDRPQELTRFGSWNLAILGRSETRFVCRENPPLLACVGPDTKAMA